LEPTGLIGVARTQVEAGRKEKAEATLTTIQSKKWPDRFVGDLQEIERLVKQR
jgi:hypothetical protein